MKTFQRRDFLKQAGCAALGTTTVWNTMLNLRTLGAAAHFNSSVAAGGDYKALVCVLLGGGSDSFNMLIPTTPDEYEVYAEVRSNLAEPNFDCTDPDNENNIRPIGPYDCASDEPPAYGVHKSLANMQSLYNEGKLAWVSNVGTLIEPVQKEGLYNDYDLPLGLFSHIDQVAHWQTAIPSERLATGWAGKMSDLLSDYNVDQPNISMNMSFSGSNILQTGLASNEYALIPGNGSLGIQGFPWNSDLDNNFKLSINNMVDYTYQDIFKDTYGRTVKQAVEGHAVYSAAYENAFNFQVDFGYISGGNWSAENQLRGTFETIAKTISIQSQLDMNRQIFFVEIGGWDDHFGSEPGSGLGNQFNDRLALLDELLGNFQASMAELEMEDCVTTFSISEFARTLTSNGQGSDHAWGSNMFVMGGAVNGGQLYGDYPSLELDNGLEIGGGVLIPTMSADQYFAEIAKWFGVMESDLPLLFPNLDKFDTSPIGFLPI